MAVVPNEANVLNAIAFADNNNSNSKGSDYSNKKTKHLNELLHSLHISSRNARVLDRTVFKITSNHLLWNKPTKSYNNRLKIKWSPCLFCDIGIWFLRAVDLPSIDSFSKHSMHKSQWKRHKKWKKNWFINNSSDFPRHFYWVDAFLAEHCNDYHCTQHFIYRSWMLHLNCHCLCRLNNDLTNYWIKSSFFLLQIVSTWYNECHCIALVVD